MKKFYPALLIILAVVSAIVAFIYFSKTAGSLPHFLPGYSQGSAHKHTKHGLVFVGLTVILLLGAWMLSGSSHEKASINDNPVA